MTTPVPALDNSDTKNTVEDKHEAAIEYTIAVLDNAWIGSALFLHGE